LTACAAAGLAGKGRTGIIPAAGKRQTKALTPELHPIGWSDSLPPLFHPTGGLIVTLKCYFKEPVRPGIPKEVLIGLIKELHRNKNRDRPEPAPLTNADFVNAVKDKLVLGGRRVPTKATFSKWLCKGSLSKACEAAGVPFQGRK
jgi:hypothetical protein